MNIAANFAPTLPPINFVLLPSTARCCGNCSKWKGPRERNGRKGFICMEGVKGFCQRKNRDFEFDKRTLTTPLSNGDCSHWKFAAH